MTPDDYERQAAEAEARADKLKALADLDYEQARWLRQQAAKLRRIEGGLRSRPIHATIRNSVTEQQIAGVAAGAKKKRRGAALHPLQAWLYSRGETMSDLAGKVGVSEQQARSWVRAKAANRIPASVAAKVAKLGYPATEANWPNGIRPGW